jgi:hypothetical protein
MSAEIERIFSFAQTAKQKKMEPKKSQKILAGLGNTVKWRARQDKTANTYVIEIAM